MIFTAMAMSAAVGCTHVDSGEIPDLGPPAPRSVTPLAIELNPRLLRRFRPLQTFETNAAEVALGKLLYFDPRLSQNHDLACNSCHPLDRHGVDHLAVSIGHDGKPGRRNAPTVFNAAGHVAQFWDGRAADLVEQARGPILDPNEMAMAGPNHVAQTLQHIPGYVVAFERAFPGEPIDLAHTTRAIAAFERTLITPSRWDRFLEGDRDALSHTEQVGLKLFADIGCVQCHTGELIGGSMFQKVGVMEPWPNQADQGRYALTHEDTDRMVFKVPSLRNVSLTGPYFHDGSVASLRGAISQMGKHQLGVQINAEEITAIEAWLHALAGEHPIIAPPTLP